MRSIKGTKTHKTHHLKRWLTFKQLEALPNIILKLILKTGWEGEGRIGFMWLRTGESGELL